MAIYISDAMQLSVPDPAELNNGLIGYKTFLNKNNVSASSSDADFPVANVANVLTAERWKPLFLPAWARMDLNQGARNINYCGIAAHTLGTSNCQIFVQYSLDGGASWITAAELTPINNRSIMLNFAKVSAATWRVRIAAGDDSTIPTIGVVYFGVSLMLERRIYGGYAPMTMSRTTQTLRNVTEGGQYAGASIISQGITGSVSLKNMTADFVRDDLDPFILQARTRPFFFAWRPFKWPLEVGFLWSSSDIRPTNMGIRDLMEASINYNGYNDE